MRADRVSCTKSEGAGSRATVPNRLALTAPRAVHSKSGRADDLAARSDAIRGDVARPDAREREPSLWHDYLGDPTVADAICDRVMHGAHKLALKGPSRRKPTKDGPAAA
ncbi:MAG: ATP-binding protein [Polyangiales bacterium]